MNKVTKEHKTYRRVLVVEDVKAISNFLCKLIQSQLNLETTAVSSFAEARSVLNHETDFFIALLDLNLPDAPDGEIVDFVLSKNIPSIILTATFDEKTREAIVDKNVIDYMIKDGFQSLKHINHLIQRVYRNQFIKVLIVDDSRGFRNYYKKLLITHQYITLEAEDGEAALVVLAENPDIKLVITDYNMPRMDGFELVSCIRKQRDKNELAIIGISAQGSGLMSARFLKSGANDFLIKPFEKEEFYARVTQNVDVLEYISELKEVATRDPLTKLFNRRYYFENGTKIFNEHRKKEKPISIAMVDIDFFKKINDTFGHDAGDTILKLIAGIMLQSFEKPHIPARFGGEEFCILICGIEKPQVVDMLEKMRKQVEQSKVVYNNKSICMTISIGISSTPANNIEEMINCADRLLYQAKHEGRNRICTDHTE